MTLRLLPSVQNVRLIRTKVLFVNENLGSYNLKNISAVLLIDLAYWLYEHLKTFSYGCALLLTIVAEQYYKDQI